MKIEITQAFGCHPNDGEAYVDFKPGDRPTDLTPEYAAILIGKGLAREIKAEAPAPAEPPPPAEPATAKLKTKVTP